MDALDQIRRSELTEAERAAKALELVEPWILEQGRLIARRYGQDLKWGDWTEGGFYVRYAGKRVAVGVDREDLEDYPASEPKDQEEIRLRIRGNLEAALG